MTVNDEVCRVWKEITMAYCEVPSRHWDSVGSVLTRLQSGFCISAKFSFRWALSPGRVDHFPICLYCMHRYNFILALARRNGKTLGEIWGSHGNGYDCSITRCSLISNINCLHIPQGSLAFWQLLTHSSHVTVGFHGADVDDSNFWDVMLCSAVNIPDVSTPLLSITSQKTTSSI